MAGTKTGVFFDARESLETKVGVLLDARDATYSKTGISLDARDATYSKTGIFLYPRTLVPTKTGISLDVRESLEVKTGVFFDSIRDLVETKTGVSLDCVRTVVETKTGVFLDCVKDLVTTKTGIFLDSREVLKTKTAVENRCFFPDEWAVKLRNLSTGAVTLLGTISKYTGNPATENPDKKLTDVSIANGDYEIFLDYSSLFWDTARDGKRKTVKIVEGVIYSQEIPAIENLRREFTSANNPILKWNVSGFYSANTFYFGVWFSTSTPVIITGEPDKVLTLFESQGEYEYQYSQGETQYVAIACIRSSNEERGEAQEIEIPWDTSVPDSPKIQFGEKNE